MQFLVDSVLEFGSVIALAGARDLLTIAKSQVLSQKLSGPWYLVSQYYCCDGGDFQVKDRFLRLCRTASFV